MRRRRRSKGTWFPVNGQPVEEETDTTVVLSGIDTAFSLGQQFLNGVIFPITFDSPQGEVDPTDLVNKSLADQLGSEYLLRRIVGKCFIDIARGSEGQDQGDLDTAIVSAGFFVARADPNGENNVPIGVANNSALEWAPSYNPLEARTLREPWIWRRTWILQDPYRPASTNAYPSFPAFPKSTAYYGSVMDGPHIDAKTARRVGQDDRLWFAVGAHSIPYNLEPSEGQEVLIGVHLDYRLFGSLRKAKQHGAF